MLFAMLIKNISEILSILAFLSGFVLDFTSFLQGLNLGLYPLHFRLFDKKEQFNRKECFGICKFGLTTRQG
jgi:hypothetical protein